MNQTSQCFLDVFSWHYLLFLAEKKKTVEHKVETPQEWWLLAAELKPAKRNQIWACEKYYGSYIE